MIKNRAYRKDGKQGIETLSEMSNYGVAPDIITFGCLALCCNDRRSSLKLLQGIFSDFCMPLKLDILNDKDHLKYSDYFLTYFLN